MSNLTINKLMNKFRHRDNKVTIQKSYMKCGRDTSSTYIWINSLEFSIQFFFILSQSKIY